MPHIDLAECTRRGIVVCTGGGSARAPAELTLALILASTRCIVADAVALRAGSWQTTVGRELHGRTLGIIGYGNIGALVAGYAKALGMHVLAWGRAASLERAAADGYEGEPELDALCERSDVVSVHLKLTPETRGLVNARRFSLMNPDALFVNTARAGLVEQGALAAALALGRPGSAAIDVFDEEPATADPLVSSDAVLATPHLGYVTWETYETYFGQAFAQVVAFAKGAPIDVANPEALEAGASGAEPA
jgi:D-3-phosphoglycerate dehydrogenase